MKVLYDHQVFAAQQWGGVSRYFSELSQRIAQTEVVSVHAPIYISEYLATCPQSLVRGVHFPVFPGVRQLANAVARTSRTSMRFDIFHPTWYNARGWRPRGAKLVHTVYDMIAELFPDDHHSYGPQAAAKKAAIKEADLVFCISEATKADLVKIMDIHPGKVAVTHLASSIQLVVPQTIGIEYPYILYVGQRTGYKNFASLLQAFKSSMALRSQFGLICFGGGAFSDLEIAAIGNLLGGGVGGVRLLQGSDEALAGAYRRAAALVCPSRYEGFGFPVLEAMACGCPVVATPAASIPEVGGDAVLYAADSSPEALRQALETLLFDRAMQDIARAKGRLRAELFSWDLTAKDTLAGYRALTSQELEP